MATGIGMQHHDNDDATQMEVASAADENSSTTLATRKTPERVSSAPRSTAASPRTPSRHVATRFYGAIRLLLPKPSTTDHPAHPDARSSISSGYYMLTREGLVVGRDPSADIRIRLLACASRHVAIVVDPETSRVFIRDLGSVTGTFVNDKRLPNSSKVELHTGDIVTIAKRQFLFEQPDDETAIPPLRKTPNTNRLLGIDTARHRSPALTALKTPATVGRVSPLSRSRVNGSPSNGGVSISGATPRRLVDDFKSASNSPQRPPLAQTSGGIVSRKLAAFSKINRVKVSVAQQQEELKQESSVDDDRKPLNQTDEVKRKAPALSRLHYLNQLKRKAGFGQGNSDIFHDDTSSESISDSGSVEKQTQQTSSKNSLSVLADAAAYNAASSGVEVMEMEDDIDYVADALNCRDSETTGVETDVDGVDFSQSSMQSYTPRKASEITDDVFDSGKRNVTFGPELSPEIFDRNHPPSTPVRRGGHTPVAVSSSRRSILKSLSAAKAVQFGRLTPVGKLELTPAGKDGRNNMSIASVDRRGVFKSTEVQQIRRGKLFTSIVTSTSETNEHEETHGVASHKRAASVDASELSNIEASANLMNAFKNRRRSLTSKSISVNVTKSTEPEDVVAKSNDNEILKERECNDSIPKTESTVCNDQNADDSDHDSAHEDIVVTNDSSFVVIGETDDGCAIIEDVDSWAVPGMDIATQAAVEKVGDTMLLDQSSSCAPSSPTENDLPEEISSKQPTFSDDIVVESNIELEITVESKQTFGQDTQIKEPLSTVTTEANNLFDENQTQEVTSNVKQDASLDSMDIETPTSQNMEEQTIDIKAHVEDDEEVKTGKIEGITTDEVENISNDPTSVDASITEPIENSTTEMTEDAIDAYQQTTADVVDISVSENDNESETITVAIDAIPILEQQTVSNLLPEEKSTSLSSMDSQTPVKEKSDRSRQGSRSVPTKTQKRVTIKENVNELAPEVEDENTSPEVVSIAKRTRSRRKSMPSKFFNDDGVLNETTKSVMSMKSARKHRAR